MQSYKCDRIFSRKLPRTTYKATIEARQNSLYKVVSSLLNFKWIADPPATSFLENQRLVLQAREQGFPKWCPTPSDSRYCAISWACNEASNLGGHIYATVTIILFKGAWAPLFFQSSQEEHKYIKTPCGAYS